MEKYKKYQIYNILYVVVLLSVSVPIACAYVPSGGDANVWLVRVESFKNALLYGGFELFPNAELVFAYGGQRNAFDSNLWLIFPALIQGLFHDFVLTHRIVMLLLQIGTLFACIKLFRTIFQDEWMAFFGTLFYLTWPYRIYITYDQVNWARSIAFMLMPLFVWAIYELYTGTKKWKMMAIGTAILTGIFYADWTIALILIGFTVVSAVWYRKWQALLSVGIAAILYLPGMKYLLTYLIKGGMKEWDLPLKSIMSDGYRLGRMLVSYVYEDGLPGIGLGLLGALMVLIGLRFVKRNFQWNKQYNFPLFAAIFLLILSMQAFPWDLVQRVGEPFLRMVSLWESPAVFFGCAGLPLSILGACAMGEIRKEKEIEVRWGIPLAIIAAAVGLTVYLCNALTFARMPLNF